MDEQVLVTKSVKTEQTKKACILCNFRLLQTTVTKVVSIFFLCTADAVVFSTEPADLW